jgi:hypothetical protein
MEIITVSQTTDRTRSAFAQRQDAEQQTGGEVTVVNPFGASAARAGGALAVAEQQRYVAEVQARMMIARANPRDPVRCMDAILRQCTRPTLAAEAIYSYPRGGSQIEGPSIRLAEAMAQCWGNIASGIKIVSRTNGSSECIAYAWDMETNFYDERQFHVRHWRDTKQGGYALEDERDIYELIANMGQRRKRAVLLTVIPGDVAEAAVNQCNQTLSAKADTSPAAVQQMLDAFREFGVVKEQIEARIQRRIESILPAQILQLRKIYASLRDEMSTPKDWFDPIAPAAGGEAQEAGTAATPAAGAKPPRAPRQRRGETATGAYAGGAPAPPSTTSQAASQPAGGGAETAANAQSATVQQQSGGDDSEFFLAVPAGSGQWRETTTEPFSDRVAWAQAFDMHLTQFPDDETAIRAENADAIEWACQSPEAAAIINPPSQQHDGGLFGDEPVVRSPAAAVQQPTGPQPLRLADFKDTAGRIAATYRTSCDQQLSGLDAAGIDAWEALNKPEYQDNIEARTHAGRALTAARVAAGAIPPAGSSPASTADQTNVAPGLRRERRQSAQRDMIGEAQGRVAEASQPVTDPLSRDTDNIISSLRTCATRDVFSAFLGSAVVTSWQGKVNAANRVDLAQRYKAALAENKKRLGIA